MPAGRLPVRLLPLAQSDIGEAVDFLAADSPSAGLRLADAFEAAVSRLSAHPALGRLPRDAALIALGYRVLTVGEYLVFYVLTPDEVLVHRVVHGARDLRRLL